MFVKVAFLLKAMICREVSIVFKVIVQTGLFLLFLFFFGIPAVEKYLRAETVIITWEEDTGGIEAPAVTFSGSLIGKVGWKGNFENASVNYVNFKIVDQCERYDDDIQQCVLDETFGLNELIVGARFGYETPVDMLMNSSFWTEDLTHTSTGRYFTFTIKNRKLTPATKDYLVFVLNKSTVSEIHVHDENFFLLNSNPLGPPINSKHIFSSTPSQYQDSG